MDKFHLPTQIGYVASTPSEARENAHKMLRQGVSTIVIKAQVFAGGRGKGTLSSGLKGGVQFAKDARKTEDFARQMLGYKLRTHQTGPEGLVVNKVLLAEGVNIDKEFYLAIILDRGKGGPVIVASREGGVDIEEVAANKPEAIHVEPIDILNGIEAKTIENVCDVLFPIEKITSKMSPSALGEKIKTQELLRSQLKELLQKLYKLFTECDASQIEINPLALTSDNKGIGNTSNPIARCTHTQTFYAVLCVDAKLNFDDNASFRQKDLFAQEDLSLRDPFELGAEELGMNFVAMDGDIGCLVNGAGLAMATMDLIAFNGRQPANFLDLGGGARKEQVFRSFELLNKDPKVKAIFVNIFGGITRCDVVAQGILEAAQELNMKKPLIVRLVGNNAEQARQILNSPELAKTGLKITYVQDFAAAAKTACDVAAAATRQ